MFMDWKMKYQKESSLSKLIHKSNAMSHWNLSPPAPLSLVPQPVVFRCYFWSLGPCRASDRTTRDCWLQQQSLHSTPVSCLPEPTESFMECGKPILNLFER